MLQQPSFGPIDAIEAGTAVWLDLKYLTWRNEKVPFAHERSAKLAFIISIQQVLSQEEGLEF